MYELWYIDTGNIADTFTTEAAALTEIRALVDDHGTSSVNMMALLHTSNHGEKRLVAQGEELLNIAQKAVSIGDSPTGHSR